MIGEHSIAAFIIIIIIITIIWTTNSTKPVGAKPLSHSMFGMTSQIYQQGMSP